jgi:hypothetical protein
MTQQTCALTAEGYVDIEAEIPLADLDVGDTVLTPVKPDAPDAPRTTHKVIATLGYHHVPTEHPTRLESFLIRIGAERLISGPKVESVLVEGADGDLGLFLLSFTPVLDRVIF